MPSGRPDWFGTIVSAGKYDDQMIPIGVDKYGHIIAVMKGDYDDVLKTIAVDENGVMKANLAVQDLDFLTVRPAYGQIEEDYSSTSCPDSEWTSLKSVSGRGIVLGGAIEWETTASSRDVLIRMSIDGTTFVTQSPYGLLLGQFFQQKLLPLYAVLYDNDNFNYITGISHGMTFESSFKFEIYNNYGSSISAEAWLYWALVP